MVEIREALDDITRDDKRAAGVIQGMRAMRRAREALHLHATHPEAETPR